MTIQVIGAGHHRTGTMSLRNALEQLGFRTHHSNDFSIPYTENHSQLTGATGRRSANNMGANFMMAIMQGQEPPVSHQEYFKDFDAVVDCIYIYDEIRTWYPSAKVILTVRDMDPWWISMSESLLPFDVQRVMADARKRNPDLPYSVLDVGVTELNKNYNGASITKELAVKHHQEHIERVKATVPADQLLIFNPKDGWKPLCDFLGVPVPDGPYPRVNEATAIKLRVKVWLDSFQKLLPDVDVYEEYMWPWMKEKVEDFKN